MSKNALDWAPEAEAFISVTSCLAQWLANNAFLKEHSEQSFISQEQGSPLGEFTPLEPQVPKAGPLGLWPGRPMGFVTASNESNVLKCFWLLKQSVEEQSSCCNLIAFQTVWCPSEHSSSSPCSHPSCHEQQQSITHRQLNNLIWLELHASTHKKTLVCPVLLLPGVEPAILLRLCSPQIIWPWAKPGITWYCEPQLPSLYNSALWPTALTG